MHQLFNRWKCQNSINFNEVIQINIKYISLEELMLY